MRLKRRRIGNYDDGRGQIKEAPIHANDRPSVGPSRRLGGGLAANGTRGKENRRWKRRGYYTVVLQAQETRRTGRGLV